jgi:hypothetical protein
MAGRKVHIGVPEFIMLNLVPKDIDSFLDIGCGGSPQTRFIRPRLRVSTDASTKLVGWPIAPFILCNALQLGEILPPRHFDLVCALDVIEHLGKDDGRKLIEIAERLCKRRVIFFTPSGELWMDGEGDPFMTHLSGWTPEEFQGLGYATWIFPDYHRPDGNGAGGAFYAVKDSVDLALMKLGGVEERYADNYWVTPDGERIA